MLDLEFPIFCAYGRQADSPTTMLSIDTVDVTSEILFCSIIYWHLILRTQTMITFQQTI
jgi:hypothetical protein